MKKRKTKKAKAKKIKRKTTTKSTRELKNIVKKELQKRLKAIGTITFKT